jgi:Eukaryotic cytochrome b561
MQLLQTIFNWLLAPLSGASAHDIAPLVAWHARLMVLAWSVLIPLGVLVARFYKVTPKQDFPVRLDNPFWWHAHRGLQYTGVFLSLVAVGLIWRKSANADAYGLHQLFGYALLILGFLQIIGAQFRGSKGGPTDVAKGLPLRGDHFDMTRRRRIFEGWHKSLGYSALALVVVTTMLGLALADAPRWMALVIAAWWLLLLAAFVILQKRGRAVDTYVAIWGKSFRGKS